MLYDEDGTVGFSPKCHDVSDEISIVTSLKAT